MRLWIILTIALLFLLACKPIVVEDETAPVQTPVPEEVQPVQEVQPQEEVNKTEQLPAVQETVTPEMPENETEEGIYERPAEKKPSIASFFSKFKNEVRNYRFKYHNDKWVVAGKNAKIVLGDVLQGQYHADFIDTVYLDLERRTAFGVCEGQDLNIKRQCINRNVLEKKYAIPFIQFKITLPEDWLKDFQNYYAAESTTPRLITDRQTVHLKYQTSTRTVDFFIDPSSGLPIAVIDDNVEYSYENLAKNQLLPNEKITLE